MKRFHALEWEDQRWFPAEWRDYGTDYLRFIAVKFDIYKAILPVIKKGIEASGSQEWIDCASGGGGGLLKLAEALKKDYPALKITLTDYYPNIKSFEHTLKEGGDTFTFEKEPVNAMDLPPRHRGKFRTMFGSFHHFRPDDAKQILQNAVDTRSPIAIFEPVAKNVMSVVSMFFAVFNVLFMTPFIRPFRPKVLPFIYAIPLIPLYVVWDGFASIIRTYSKKELQEMVNSLKDSESFEWEIGSKQDGPMPVHYLLGIPKK
jgi:hypothetical protein